MLFLPFGSAGKNALKGAFYLFRAVSETQSDCTGCPRRRPAINYDTNSKRPINTCLAGSTLCQKRKEVTQANESMSCNWPIGSKGEDSADDLMDVSYDCVASSIPPSDDESHERTLIPSLERSSSPPIPIDSLGGCLISRCAKLCRGPNEQFMRRLKCELFFDDDLISFLQGYGPCHIAGPEDFLNVKSPPLPYLSLFGTQMVFKKKKNGELLVCKPQVLFLKISNLCKLIQLQSALKANEKAQRLLITMQSQDHDHLIKPGHKFGYLQVDKYVPEGKQRGKVNIVLSLVLITPNGLFIQLLFGT